MVVGLEWFLMSSSLYVTGLSGIAFNRKNVLILLMSIELMLLAINFHWIGFSLVLEDVMGQVFALFILTVAAAESAIGLGILVIYYRVRGTIGMDWVNLLRG
jgi:NADH-quinone oxidoreductase subunit K